MRSGRLTILDDGNVHWGDASRNFAHSHDLAGQSDWSHLASSRLALVLVEWNEVSPDAVFGLRGRRIVSGLIVATK